MSQTFSGFRVDYVMPNPIEERKTVGMQHTPFEMPIIRRL